MNIPPVLKNKWVWIGGGAIFIIVLAMSGSKGGSTSSGASGPSDATVAAQRDITLAQIQMQIAQGAQAADVAKIQAQGNVDLATGALNAQLQQYAIDAQTAINTLQVTSQRDINLASLSTDSYNQKYALDTQAMMQKYTLDQATQNANIQANFQLDYAEAANQTQIFLAQTQAQLVAAQIVANRDITMAGFATQEQLAAINSNLQLGVTQSNNTTQAAVYAGMNAAQIEQTRLMIYGQTEQARINAKAKGKSDVLGFLGGVAGVLGGIFSDPRLKRDVVALGARPEDGLGIYAYRYIGGTRQYIGFMADEVALVRPDALGPQHGPFLTVDYERLN